MVGVVQGMSQFHDAQLGYSFVCDHGLAVSIPINMMKDVGLPSGSPNNVGFHFCIMQGGGNH
jgi:hypothetical protein